MHKQRTSRRSLRRPVGALIVLVAGLAIFLAGHADNSPRQYVATKTQHKASLTTPVFRGLPVRLKIPAVDIDTSIEYLGIDSKGDMAVPSGPGDVAWYRFGSIPGEQGSAVMAGHVVGLEGQQAVFYNLDKVQVGDVVSVVDSKGNVASFSVSKIATYDDTQQTNEIFNSSSGTHLNLITCSGDWDSAHHHYLKRLVVFADEK